MEFNELFAALAVAQGEMLAAEKSHSHGAFKKMYSDFSDVVQASRPALSKNGLCVVQILITDGSHGVALKTILGHSSGQFIESFVRLEPQDAKPQSLGSAITYMKRYAYTSIVGVVDGEDTDSNTVTPAKASHNPHDEFEQGKTITKTANAYQK